jgi:hypothetical protein
MTRRNRAMPALSDAPSVSNPSAVHERPVDQVARPAALLLPLTVRIVRTEEHLSKAVAVRADSYGRHFPEVGERFRTPEAADRSAFSLVLLAESKSNGEALGTLRIETNSRGPLPVEGLLQADSPCAGKTVAFVTRLGVKNGPDASLVKLALFKALHRYCLACQVDWIIVIARPPMDRQYLKLGFKDVYSPDTLIPIRWAENVPMRLLALESISCEREWRASSNPLYQFMFMDYCPDIQIFSSVTGVWGQPRSNSSQLPLPKDLDSIFGISIV